MRFLNTALYAEGPTDVEFLCPLLGRLCAELLMESGVPVELSDVLPLLDLPEHRALPRDHRILEAARAADGAWMLLFIHADADGDARAAVAERVEPARQLIRRAFDDRQPTVAVVPVRMTEAWILSDADALRKGLGTSLSDADLGLADVIAHGPESVTKPKAVLQQVFNRARPQRRAASIGPYLGRIGACTSLQKLRRLDAFRSMEADLRHAVSQLGFFS